ncbi:T9SS type A sorting domain-containing protein [Hydrotalea sp.]|uniref:T9SS type A sorting domain-containing protein n=1 Tax=Hydrotalea sp. TaxID=2881279 RepID=UPI003D0D4B9F
MSSINATVSLNGTNYNTNSVNVSITQPNLSINGLSSFCSGSNNYFINNLPCNVTVSWSAAPYGIANLSTNGNTATLTQTGNGDVTLQAAVNNVCGQNYPSITQTIHIGTPNPPTITNLNYDNTCGTFVEAYSDVPANTTGFIWNFNYGQVIQNNPGTSGNYFLLKPLGQNKVGFTYYDYLSVQATNNCGISAPSATSAFTVGPIASNCGSGGGKGFLSTGPIIGQPLAESKASTNKNVRVFPNPVRASLTIQLPDSIHLTNTFITITNMDGRRIVSLHPNSLNPVITTTLWAAGMYLVTIYEGTKKIAVQQVLKYE